MASRAALLTTWVATVLLGRVSARLTRRVVLRLWFTPWPTPTSTTAQQREARWLATTSPLRIDVDGRRIAGFQAGMGPTVLLVHGWGDYGARLGAFVAPLVVAGYRVVGVDLPSHGASGRGSTDIPSQAAALVQVGRELGGVHAVIAHSMGGATTLVAQQGGLGADALVLLAPAVRLAHAMRRFGQMFGLPQRAVQGLRDGIEARFGKTVWEDYAADLIAADLDVPALIVHDTADRQIDFADAALLARAWPTAQLAVTHGLGHQRLIRDPGVVARAAEFISGLSEVGVDYEEKGGGVAIASEASSPR